MTRARAKQISQRERRLMRLLFLMGRGPVAVAAAVGRDKAVVSRYMNRHGLLAPETPLERYRLAVDHATDLTVEQLIGDPPGGDVLTAAGAIARLAGEARRIMGVTEAGDYGADEEGEDSESVRVLARRLATAFARARKSGPERG